MVSGYAALTATYAGAGKGHTHEPGGPPTTGVAQAIILSTRPRKARVGAVGRQESAEAFSGLLTRYSHKARQAAGIGTARMRVGSPASRTANTRT